MLTKGFRELENNILGLIAELKVIREIELYILLNIEDLRPNYIVGNRKYLYNKSKRVMFNQRMLSLCRKNHFLWDFEKVDNYYVSFPLPQKFITNMDEYKNMISLFSALGSNVNIPSLSDIKVISERIIDFNYELDGEIKHARLVNYKRVLTEEEILPTRDKNYYDNIMILLDENTINYYKDIKVPLNIKYSVYTKYNDEYVRSIGVEELKDSIC